jgi:transcriptional regulator with XRE-family HTH domain
MQQSNKSGTLGSQIDTARERKSAKIGSYTLYRLAKDAKIDYSHLSRVIHGKSLPSRDKLIKICKALDCSPEEAKEIFKATEYREPTEEELKEESPQESIAVAS